MAFHALRPYQLGDDHRHIHWMSTARTGSVMVRQNVDNRVPSVVVLLDPRRRSDRFFEEADGWDGLTVRTALSPEALAAMFRERLLKQSMTVWARLPYGFEIR